MPLKVTLIKVKVSKGDGTSEIRRLRYSKECSTSFGVFQNQADTKYYASLLSFVMDSLGQLYPDLPVCDFNKHVVFSVKDEDDDMVSFSSTDEFLEAVNSRITSYDSSAADSKVAARAAVMLRVEVNVKSKPVTGMIPPATTTNTTSIALDTANADQVPVRPDVPVMSTAPSDNGNSDAFNASAVSPSFVRMSPSAGLFEGVPPPSPSSLSTRSVGYQFCHIPTMCGPPPQGAVPLMDPAVASPPATSPPVPSPPAAFPAAAAPIPVASPQVSGDSATPTTAFLSQLLPSLADVVARSIYATQWTGPHANPYRTPAAPTVSPAAAPPEVCGNSQSTDPCDPIAMLIKALDATTAERPATSSPTQAPAPPMNSTSAGTGSPEVHQQTCANPMAQNVPADQESSAPCASPSAACAESDPPIVHMNIVCDGCDVTPIVGTRYKCAVRSDFDLCEACEAGVGTDSPFPFLKIRTPAQSPAAIICLLKPDQGSNMDDIPVIPPLRGRSVQDARMHLGVQGRRTPQRGGWGEGRRNQPRWMRDLARRQANWNAAFLSASRDGAAFGINGRSSSSPPPWCGPRMQRNRQEEGAAAQNVEDNEKPKKPVATEGEVGTIGKERQDPPTRPASSNNSEDGSTPLVDDTVEPSNIIEDMLLAPIAAGDEAPKKDDGSPKDVAPAVSASAVADTPQSAEYHDMLVASMRSLASSMTSSFPAASTLQQEKPRGSPQADGKSQVKPMARFVTDVSVVDGSPLPPNTRFIKTWCMRNDGTVVFPPGCRLMPGGGDLMDGPEEGVAVEQRSPGEEFHVSVPLTTPPKSGRYIGYWRLRTAMGQNFGHRIWADVLVTGGTADLIDENSLDGDWDLINMQRLTRAVEDTAKDAEAAAAAAAETAEIVATAAHVAAPPASMVSDAKEVDVSFAQESEPNPDISAGPTVALEIAPDDMTGHEEMKSSDSEGAVLSDLPAPSYDSIMTGTVPDSNIQPQPQPLVQAQCQVHPQVQGFTMSPQNPEIIPQAPTTKWHRELCSLAEMGFEDTARNISLLEKYVSSSGGPGMERVLHELLSWTEVTF